MISGCPVALPVEASWLQYHAWGPLICTRILVAQIQGVNKTAGFYKTKMTKLCGLKTSDILGYWFDMIGDHHWSRYPQKNMPARLKLNWIHTGFITRCRFWNHTNTFIGPGSILEYLCTLQNQFQHVCFFRLHNTCIHNTCKKNLLGSVCFKPTCVAVQESNPE